MNAIASTVAGPSGTGNSSESPPPDPPSPVEHQPKAPADSSSTAHPQPPSLRLPSPAIVKELATYRASINQFHQRFTAPGWPKDRDAGLHSLRRENNMLIASTNRANELTEHWIQEAQLWHQEAMKQYRLARDAREEVGRLQREGRVERACWWRLLQGLPAEAKTALHVDSGFLERLRATGVEVVEEEEGMWTMADYVRNLATKLGKAEEATRRSLAEEQKARDAEKDAKSDVTRLEELVSKLKMESSVELPGDVVETSTRGRPRRKLIAPQEGTEIGRLEPDEYRGRISRLNEDQKTQAERIAQLKEDLRAAYLALSHTLTLYLGAKFALRAFFLQAHRWAQEINNEEKRERWWNHNLMYFALKRIAKQRGIWTVNGGSKVLGAVDKNQKKMESPEETDGEEIRRAQEKHEQMVLEQARTLLETKFAAEWAEIEFSDIPEMDGDDQIPSNTRRKQSNAHPWFLGDLFSKPIFSRLWPISRLWSKLTGHQGDGDENDEAKRQDETQGDGDEDGEESGDEEGSEDECETFKLYQEWKPKLEKDVNGWGVQRLLDMLAEMRRIDRCYSGKDHDQRASDQ